MSAKHTPGPWIVRDNGEGWVCPIIDSPSVGGGYYASIATATQRDPHPREGGGISTTTARANARLIAAAPDLLAALEKAVEHYGKPGGPWSVPSEPGTWIADACAAIAKAKGEGA